MSNKLRVNGNAHDHEKPSANHNNLWMRVKMISTTHPVWVENAPKVVSIRIFEASNNSCSRRYVQSFKKQKKSWEEQELGWSKVLAKKLPQTTNAVCWCQSCQEKCI